MANIILPNHFELRTEYVGLTDLLKKDLDNEALKHINNRQDSYLKKYVLKEDAEVKFHVHVSKTKDERYECKFNSLLDGDQFYWKNDQPFKEPFDVINHAFKHLKEHLAHK